MLIIPQNLLFLFFFLFQWTWGPTPVQADEKGNDLMEHEEWILLEGLDSICTDTWCEGSFDFHFQSFKCSFKEQKCLMSYTSQDPADEYSIQNPLSFTCVIKALNRTELFGTELDFWVSSYLYSGVTECIEQSEKWIREEYRQAFNDINSFL